MRQIIGIKLTLKQFKNAQENDTLLTGVFLPIFYPDLIQVDKFIFWHLIKNKIGWRVEGYYLPTFQKDHTIITNEDFVRIVVTTTPTLWDLWNK